MVTKIQWSPAAAPATSTSTAATSPAAGTTPASTPATTPASTPSAPRRRSSPMLTTGQLLGMKPAEIAYSGDATNVVTKIQCSAWTATGATGTGTSDLDS